MPKPFHLLLSFLFSPIFWGMAFLAPLIASVLTKSGLTAPFNLSELQFALIIGVVWGSYAKVKGSWL